MKQNGFRCFPMHGDSSARMINYFHQICVHVPSLFTVDAVRKSVYRNAFTAIHHILYVTDFVSCVRTHFGHMLVNSMGAYSPHALDM